MISHGFFLMNTKLSWYSSTISSTDLIFFILSSSLFIKRNLKMCIFARSFTAHTAIFFTGFLKNASIKIYDKSKNYKRHKRCVIGREIIETGYKHHSGIACQHKLIHYEFAQQRCHCVWHRNAELREVIHLHRLTARWWRSDTVEILTEQGRHKRSA